MKVVIVEDEKMVARRLQRLLKKIMGDSDVHIEAYNSFAAAKNNIKQTETDLLFLDLNINGEDGFQLLAEAVAGPQKTIIVSANADRAIEAYEYGVIDFVAKPFDEQRLALAVKRAQGQQADQSVALKFLSFRTPKGTEVIKIENILAFHGAGDYSEAMTTDNRSLLHNKTMNQLEQMLPDNFLRIHRSHIINLDYVTAIHTQEGSRYSVTLNQAHEIPVSRSKIKSLRDSFKTAL